LRRIAAFAVRMPGRRDHRVIGDGMPSA